ncbi:MAG: HAD hydrolase-like protein [Desulfobaccales bacterium]|nr:HAD hydrolase-like protein [Desulfobaccales bacterium]
MQDWQAFFFDFDGVLADSVEVKTRAFARLFEAHGPEIMAKVVDHHRRHSGVTRVDKFRHYYQEFLKQPLSDAGLAELCQRFACLVVDEVVAAPEISGAGDFLRDWAGKLPCFVVSATPEEEIRLIVQRRSWSAYFQEVCGAPKSKGENLKSLLTKHALTPARCLFFGDAESDYRAAQACGVPFLGILPDAAAPLLKAAPEVKWVRDFTEVAQLLHPPGKLMN